ncbi:MAG TPA: hypothetical protein VH396_02225 [Chitinophagaceae bacterium]|jgi:hypothetical protein
MDKKSKDLRDAEEQGQPDVGNPKEQQKSKQDMRNNNMLNTTPPNSLLGQRAEEYLREQANIEDLPNEKDQEDYDEAIKKSKKK